MRTQGNILPSLFPYVLRYFSIRFVLEFKHLYELFIEYIHQFLTLQ